MAKKKLILNESTTRRFMKLATIKPTYVSNFLTEAEKEEEKDEKVMKEQEEDEDLAPEEGEGMPEAEPEMDASMEVEDEMDMDDEGAGGDAEALVMDLLSKVQEFAQENGVSMELEGDEEEGEMEDMDDEGMEMDAEPEGGDMEPPAEDEMPEDAEANYGAMQEEVDADLDAAGVSVVDEDAIVAEVTRRVARRLLRESAKRK